MSRAPFKAAERLSNLQTEVGSVLERLWRFGTSVVPFEGQGFLPAIELREEMDRYVVLAELPGIAAAGLEVTAGPASVTISGERAKPDVPSFEGAQAEYPRVLQSERRYGRFDRTIALPGSVRVDGVTAGLRDGVLSVELPKMVGPKPVEVRVEVCEHPGT